MPRDLNATPPSDWLSDQMTAAEVAAITEFLTQRGTFEFPALPNGLFSAAGSVTSEIEVTGYANVWIRDNIHIAWAHAVVGDDARIPVRCIKTLLKYFSRHRQRFRDIIEGRADAQDPMNRPHVRFSGRDLSELPEKWSHAQNDALGYFLWLTSRLVADNSLAVNDVSWQVVGDLVQYWETIRYWQDEDSGHWEESRKVSASSIGTAVAGLELLRQVMQHSAVAARLAATDAAVTGDRVDRLIESGRTALRQILPSECIQPDPQKRRDYDAALLFLIYPLQVVDTATADRIVQNVRDHLQGPYGIRRYPGDSYWCANYRQLLDATIRTADFSDNMADRDRLLQPGMEAQWCIFDPILACLFGQRYLHSRNPHDLQQLLIHARRSLAQLTDSGSRFGAYRCPESYYAEQGVWQPNDITPLLWTQANLWQALSWLRRCAAVRAAD